LAKKVASKNVDITTSQNVLVSYELASVFQRIIAGFIDSVLVLVLNLLRWAIFPTSVSNPASFFSIYIFLVWLYQLAIIVFFKGRSVGMRIMGIRIISLNGETLEFSDYFLRWIVRPLDITLSFCAVGIFSMLATEKRQRLGDMLAGTSVVKLNPNSNFTLRDIMAFHQSTKPENVKYPSVKYIEETHMLFIKNLLQNTESYSQDINDKAIDQATKKLCELLKIETIPTDKRAFLNQLVNDYIVMTR